MVLTGIHPITEYLDTQQGRRLAQLTLLVAGDSAALQRLRALAVRRGVPVQRMSRRELTGLTGSSSHRGVALLDGQPAAAHGGGSAHAAGAAPGTGGGAPGTGAAPGSGAPPEGGSVRRGNRKPAAAQRGPGSRATTRRPPAAERLSDAVRTLGAQALVLVLDGITDPVNLGSILRSADQFAVDLVVAPQRRAAAITDTVLRVSAGAAAHVRLLTVSSLAQALATLRRAEVWVYGADLGGTPLHATALPQRLALVLGSEGSGLHELVRARCDALVSIPTAGAIDSLNVGVAAGILMYEARRQHPLVG